jgi:hypothetical protein
MPPWVYRHLDAEVRQRLPLSRIIESFCRPGPHALPRRPNTSHSVLSGTFCYPTGARPALHLSDYFDSDDGFIDSKCRYEQFVFQTEQLSFDNYSFHIDVVDKNYFTKYGSTVAIRSRRVEVERIRHRVSENSPSYHGWRVWLHRTAGITGRN